MTFKNYREQSRDIQWGIHNDSETLSLEQINCGSLLRIADSMEVVAKEYNAILADMKFYQKRYHELLDKVERLKRSNAALRGVITKMKGAGHD